jgi:hypothetical protein
MNQVSLHGHRFATSHQLPLPPPDDVPPPKLDVPPPLGDVAPVDGVLPPVVEVVPPPAEGLPPLGGVVEPCEVPPPVGEVVEPCEVFPLPVGLPPELVLAALVLPAPAEVPPLPTAFGRTSGAIGFGIGAGGAGIIGRMIITGL